MHSASAFDDFEHRCLVGRAELMPQAMKDAERAPTTSSSSGAVSAGA
jgi:hypothetical protein